MDGNLIVAGHCGMLKAGSQVTGDLVSLGGNVEVFGDVDGTWWSLAEMPCSPMQPLLTVAFSPSAET